MREAVELGASWLWRLVSLLRSGKMGQREWRNGSKAVRWEREWGRGLLWREREACARACSEWGRSSVSGRNDGGVGQSVGQRGQWSSTATLCECGVLRT